VAILPALYKMDFGMAQVDRFVCDASVITLLEPVLLPDIE